MAKFSMDNLPPASPQQQGPRKPINWPFREYYGPDWFDDDRDPYEYGGTGTSEDVNPNEGSKG